MLHEHFDVFWLDLDVFLFQSPTPFVARTLQREPTAELLVSGAFAADCRTAENRGFFGCALCLRTFGGSTTCSSQKPIVAYYYYCIEKNPEVHGERSSFKESTLDPCDGGDNSNSSNFLFRQVVRRSPSLRPFVRPPRSAPLLGTRSGGSQAFAAGWCSSEPPNRPPRWQTFDARAKTGEAMRGS